MRSLQPTIDICRPLARALRRVAGFLLILALVLEAVPHPAARAEASGMIRVRLTRLGAPNAITLETDCAYVLSGEVRMNISAGSRVTLRAEGGALTLECGGLRLHCGAQAQLLRCGSSGVRFVEPALANQFCGDLTFAASGGTVLAVLRLYIEDYLCGVVGYEMSNSYPLEALKAQAIAARNYALRKMASRASKSYDLTDNTSDQVFKGYNAGQTRVIQAVRETRGQALYAGSELAACYYGASNGGQTESTQNAWGNILSYSVVREDPYDLENPSSKQTVAVIRRDGTGLNAALEAALRTGIAAQLEARGMDGSDAGILSIDSIVPCNPKYAQPSRLYRTLRFGLTVGVRGERAEAERIAVEVDIPSYGGLEDWYGLSINSASNETIAVESDAEAFRVIFRRWGHGIGMSQRGAQRMAANDSMSCAEILDFYYPGTTLRGNSLAQEGAHGQLSQEHAIATARLPAGGVLRAGAAADAPACAELVQDLQLSVYAVEGRWARVGCEGFAGWAPVEMLSGFALADDPILPVEENCVLTEEAGRMELPAERARTLDLLPAGTALSVFGRSKVWAQVRCADGREGYVRAAALETPTLEPSATPDASPSATPDATPSATPDATPSATPEASPSATPDASLSATPDATPSATPEASPSATPEATPSATPEATPSVTPEATPSATPKATPSATPGASPTVRTTQSFPPVCLPTPRPVETFAPQPTVVDYPMPTPNPAPAGAEGMMVATGTLYAYVSVSSDSSLTLRKSASSSAAPVAYLQRGTRVQMLAFNDDWACVRTASGRVGFASRRYLNLPGEAGSAQPVAQDVPKQQGAKFREKKTNVTICKRAAVTKLATKVYAGSSTSSAVLDTLPAAAKVTVTAYNKTWAYVYFGNQRGFVPLKNLKAA